jgi:hypothetical protein
MKTQNGRFCSILSLTSALVEGLVVKAKPRLFHPWKRLGTHCVGGWVGLGAVLDGCEMSRPHWDSITGQ